MWLHKQDLGIVIQSAMFAALMLLSYNAFTESANNHAFSISRCVSYVKDQQRATNLSLGLREIDAQFEQNPHMTTTMKQWLKARDNILVANQKARAAEPHPVECDTPK